MKTKTDKAGRFVLMEYGGWYFTGSTENEALVMRPPDEGEPFSPYRADAKRFRTRDAARRAAQEWWGDGNCRRSLLLCEITPTFDAETGRPAGDTVFRLGQAAGHNARP